MVGYGRPLKADPWEWKYTTSPAGSSGGSAEGASEGRQPLTGPHLPPVAQAAQIEENESFRTRRVQTPPFKGQALAFFLLVAVATKLHFHAARRAGGPNNRKGKPPRLQGAKAFSQRTDPALLSSTHLPRTPSQLASRASLFYTEKILAAQTAAPNHIFCPARGA